MQLCPQCLKPRLRYSSGFIGIYAPGGFECLNCGYKGFIYVDVDGRDNKEALQMEMLREEFAEYVEETKDAPELARMCLGDKWAPDQANNHNSLRAWCPFCADVNVVCSICKCPPNICSDHATGGLIGELNELYDDEVELCDVDPKIYGQIVREFQKIAKIQGQQ